MYSYNVFLLSSSLASFHFIISGLFGEETNETFVLFYKKGRDRSVLATPLSDYFSASGNEYDFKASNT